MKTILDLCGGTGAWSRSYSKAGYNVFIVDPQDIREDTLAGLIKMDVREFWKALYANQVLRVQRQEGGVVQFYKFGPGDIQGILCAPPCTHFAGSGAQYWKEKDADGRTQDHLSIVDACLNVVDFFKPVWWVMENPVGRLGKLRPELGKPKMYFQPYEYGDPWTKKTCLWGNFNGPEKNPVEPRRYTKQGSWTQRLGGKSMRTKRLRSITPQGFANAFFEANP